METVEITFDDDRAELYHDLEERYGDERMRRLCLMALDIAMIEAAEQLEE